MIEGNALAIAEFEKNQLAVALLLQLDFTDGTQYFTNWQNTLTIDGIDWVGLGTLVSVGTVTESASPQSNAVTFTLSPIDPALLSMTLNDTETYKGQPCTLYMVVMDQDYKVVGEKILLKYLVMDQVKMTTAVTDQGVNGALALVCEDYMAYLSVSRKKRMNNVYHTSLYPDEKGFEYLDSLITDSYTWLSVEFQTV